VPKALFDPMDDLQALNSTQLQNLGQSRIAAHT
jgi:hypothetical protein